MLYKRFAGVALTLVTAISCIGSAAAFETDTTVKVLSDRDIIVSGSAVEKTENDFGTVQESCSNDVKLPTVELYSYNAKYKGEGGYIYFDTNTGTITDADWGLTAIEIPTEINGVAVTNIGDNAFVNTDLTHITIPYGITAIGNGAFAHCGKLQSIEISDSVTSIGEKAFAYSRLTSIIIPDSVTDIGNSAFYFCNALVSVEIGSGLSSIGEAVFMGCHSLENIVIPDSITGIGYGAFNGCRSLTNIVIPGSVKSIDDYAFWECTALNEVTVCDGVTEIGNYVFRDCTSLKNIKIAASVTSIGVRAFEDCSSLTGIIIPNGITGIDADVFTDCSSLTSVVIPDSVTSIGIRAFSGCSSLTEIIIPNSVTSLGLCAFAGCSSLEEIVIPDSITSIGVGAFQYCSNLKDITIPNSITVIAASAFNSCSSLTDIAFPDSVTSIGDHAFWKCSSLKNITIPDSVTSIGDYAFSDCGSLTSIIIPEGVTDIGNYAFQNCDMLTILCKKGSEAEIFAQKNNIPYKYISDSGRLILSTEKTYTMGTVTDITNCLTAVLTPHIEDKSGIVWESSNPDEVEIVNSGSIDGTDSDKLLCNLKCKTEGTSIVTVTLKDGESASCLVRVEYRDTRIVSIEGINNVLEVGRTLVLTSKVMENDVEIEDKKDIKWTSSDNTVAVVAGFSDGTCTVMAVGSGVVTITATLSNGAYDEYVIEVNDVIYGDADGNNTLTAADAAAVLQKVLNSAYKVPLEEKTSNYMLYLDVDAGGTLTAADSAAILQKVLNSAYAFPCEDNT